jgi:hypothetical protein
LITLSPRELMRHRSRFDPAAFQYQHRLYLKHKTDPQAQILLADLLQTCLPIIRQALGRFGRVDFDIADEMIRGAAISIWQALDRGSIDVDGNVRSWLFKRCLWRMQDVLRRSGTKVFDFESKGIPYESIVANLPNQRDVERQIFSDQLKRLLARDIRRNVRFKGRKRDACLFIAERMLSGDTFHPREISERFQVDNVRFFMNYIRLQLRILLDDHRPLPGETADEKQWINDLFATA